MTVRVVGVLGRRRGIEGVDLGRRFDAGEEAREKGGEAFGE